MNEVKDSLYIYDRATKQLLQTRWIDPLSGNINAELQKHVGYSSPRIIEILGTYLFWNIPSKIIMVDYDTINDNTDDHTNDGNNELSIVDDDDDNHQHSNM